jgi:hypothetical protein
MQARWMFTALVIAACGQSSAPVAVDAADAVPPTAALAVAPTTVARGASMTATVTLTHFTLVDPNVATTPAAGEGHYHIFFDDASTYTAAWTPTFTIPSAADNAAGVHHVRIQLVNSIHQKVVPVTEATASYTLQ